MKPATQEWARVHVHDSLTFTHPPKVAMLRRSITAGALFATLVVCWRAAEIRPLAIFEPDAVTSVLAFVRGLFPPDVSPEFLRVVAAAAGRTMAIAVAGTTLSVLFGLPLGMLATATLFRRGVVVAGEPRSIATSALRIMSAAILGLLGFLRAVPDLMWGLMFVVAVGLGSLAGTLALAVAYCGVLGRVYADVFENVDPRPVEAIHAAGATRIQVFLRAVWPQALPGIVAYTLYSFECCVRAASVLGFIGAGGIGYEINISMRLFEYRQVLTLISAFVALVTLTDAFSRFVRRRLRANAPAGSLAHQHLTPTSRLRRRLTLNGRAATVITVSLVTAALAASFQASGFFSASIFDAGLVRRVSRFVGNMIPPDLDPQFLLSLGTPLLQTFGISVMGTIIGVIIGGAACFPATSRLVDTDTADAGSSFAPLRLFAYAAARLMLAVLRSIPELVWVLISIIAVGLGAFAGTVAIGLHTAGVLGKLYAETLEEVPRRPLEALRATGANAFQVLLWGIWPQARPMLTSYTVLRWETNLRVSTVLGLVGGGGLGQAIYNNVQLGFYPRVATLVAVVYLLVITTDWIGTRLSSRSS